MTNAPIRKLNLCLAGLGGGSGGRFVLLRLLGLLRLLDWL